MPAAWLRIVKVTKHEILCQRIQSKYPDCSKYLRNCLNVHLHPIKIKKFTFKSFSKFPHLIIKRSINKEGSTYNMIYIIYRHQCVLSFPNSLVLICSEKNLWDVERDHPIVPKKIFQWRNEPNLLCTDKSLTDDTMERTHTSEDRICIRRSVKDSQYIFAQLQHYRRIDHLISGKIYMLSNLIMWFIFCFALQREALREIERFLSLDSGRLACKSKLCHPSRNDYILRPVLYTRKASYILQD